MLFKVMENVVKFFPVLILFTGIFAFGFYCLFQRDDEFNKFEYSILRTVTLAIGEFEFRDLFLESETPRYHYIPGCILVLILFAVMTISAMNLLVAIAIGEFSELKKRSEAIAFSILVDQIFECQEVMRLFCKCFKAERAGTVLESLQTPKQDHGIKRQDNENKINQKPIDRIRAIIRHTDKHLGLIMTPLCSLLHSAKPSP